MSESNIVSPVVFRIKSRGKWKTAVVSAPRTELLE